MESEPLPPIPTQPGHRWREFRIKQLPFLVFAGVLVALYFTWSNLVQPVSVVGMVETNLVAVTTIQAGMLKDLSVSRFDEVTNGQVLGQIELFDADQIAAETNALKSADLISNAKEEVLIWGKQDNAIQTRIALFSQMSVFDTAAVNWQQASNVVVTDKKLIGLTNSLGTEGQFRSEETALLRQWPTNSLVTESQFRLDLAKRDAFWAEMTNHLALVNQFRRELDFILPIGTNAFSNLQYAISNDIKYQIDRLMQLQKPVVLRAPISGRISAVLHRPGQHVPAGQAIVTISSSQTARIVAYVRQPLNYRPRLGEMVTVRTRTTRRRTGQAQVVKVGTQLEPISALLLPVTTRPTPELGLPIALILPDELELLPGEIVDLRFSKN